MCVGAGLELNSAGLLPPCSTLAKKGLFAISNVHQNDKSDTLAALKA